MATTLNDKVAIIISVRLMEIIVIHCEQCLPYVSSYTIYFSTSVHFAFIYVHRLCLDIALVAVAGKRNCSVVFYNISLILRSIAALFRQ